MRLLLTGATGFVGRHAAGELAGAGHAIRCLVRAAPGSPRAAHLAEIGCSLVEGHLLDGDALRRAVLDVDAVVHVAGVIAARSFTEMRRVNVEGVARLASACAGAPRPPSRFVLISSLAAGGPSRDAVGVREGDAPRPVSVYGRSKLDGERAAARALTAATALTVIRPPAVYGPHDRGILEFFRAAARGLRLRVGTAARPVSVVHGADLARGIRMALESERAAGRTYYVANRDSLPLDGMLDMVAEAVGRRGLGLRVPEALLRLAGVVGEEVARATGRVPTFSRDKAQEFLAPGWTCCSQRAAEELGWRPEIPLERGLAQTAAWYREAGWI